MMIFKMSFWIRGVLVKVQDYNNLVILCRFRAVYYCKINEGGFEETQNVDVEYIITLMTSFLFYTAYGNTVARNYMSIYSE